MNDKKADSETRGIILVFVSYVIWGLFPLYWRLLDGVPAVEIALHRIVWCALFAAGVMLWRGRWAEVWCILVARRLVGALLVSGLLVTVDWAVYIWGVASRQVVEASLGLFVTPLFSIALGVVLLGERLSKVRMAALVLGVAALLVQMIALGHIPWVALGISVSFGLYGYVRKMTPVDPLDGLLVETGLLTPIAAAVLCFLTVRGTGAFGAYGGSHGAAIDVFLVLSGVVTAVPLAMFVSGARAIRLSTVGFVQYFSPGLTLGLAVFGFGESFSAIDGAAFSCLWAALVLVALEQRAQKWLPVLRKKLRQNKEPERRTDRV